MADQDQTTSPPPEETPAQDQATVRSDADDELPAEGEPYAPPPEEALDSALKEEVEREVDAAFADDAATETDPAASKPDGEPAAVAEPEAAATPAEAQSPAAEQAEPGETELAQALLEEQPAEGRKEAAVTKGQEKEERGESSETEGGLGGLLLPPLRALVFLLSVIDRPFRGVGPEPRDVLGKLGLACLVTAVLIFIFALLRPPFSWPM